MLLVIDRVDSKDMYVYSLWEGAVEVSKIGLSFDFLDAFEKPVDVMQIVADVLASKIYASHGRELYDRWVDYCPLAIGVYVQYIPVPVTPLMTITTTNGAIPTPITDAAEAMKALTSASQGASAVLAKIAEVLYFDDISDGEVLATLPVQERAHLEFEKVFPNMDAIVQFPPEIRELITGVTNEPAEPTTLAHAIMDLNDNYGWSREQIADWLETLDIDLTIRSQNEHNDGD